LNVEINRPTDLRNTGTLASRELRATLASTIQQCFIQTIARKTQTIKRQGCFHDFILADETQVGDDVTTESLQIQTKSSEIALCFRAQKFAADFVRGRGLTLHQQHLTACLRQYTGRAGSSQAATHDGHFG